MLLSEENVQIYIVIDKRPIGDLRILFRDIGDQHVFMRDWHASLKSGLWRGRSVYNKSFMRHLSLFQISDHCRSVQYTLFYPCTVLTWPERCQTFYKNRSGFIRCTEHKLCQYPKNCLAGYLRSTIISTDLLSYRS